MACVRRGGYYPPELKCVRRAADSRPYNGTSRTPSHNTAKQQFILLKMIGEKLMKAVVTVIGKDQKGIIAKVSNILFENEVL